MQFNSNSDFPAGQLPAEQWAQVARPPVQFDVAEFIPCACITTRVLIRGDNANRRIGVGGTGADAQQVLVGGVNYIVKTAKGVLVRTSTNNIPQSAGADGAMGGAAGLGDSGGGWSDSSSEFSDMDDDLPAPMQQQQAAQNGSAANEPLSSNNNSNQPLERAYWLRRTLRAAIYGQVRYGIVLHKLNPPIQTVLPGSAEWTTIEWEETNESVAIKEMNWEHIRSQRDRLAEDPIKEVASMQYLSEWLLNEQRQNTISLVQQLAQAGGAGNLDMNSQLAAMNLTSQLGLNGSGSMLNSNMAMGNNQQWLGQQQPIPQVGITPELQTLLQQQQMTPQSMLESHVMMPMDLLSDDRNLYSVMPYCAGGELFDVLEKKNRFSEPEARFWMRQILHGLSCLKKAGVAHRDLSLENLLVHDGNVLVIDMGMCLRVPFIEHGTGSQRYLITPQGVCGKWHYMSPEVCKNQLPFDGPAVDLWAAGVILFLMLTGFPPWERPVLTDERFKYMSNGYLVQMLTEWQIGLSADAMDLLQRMFWLDPTDRLSLEQVCAHPWMTQ